MLFSLGARHDFLRRYGVADSWRALTLGDLAQVVGGGTPSRDESRFWIGGKIPWATPTDLTANQAKYIYKTAECITEAGLASSATSLLPVGSILYASRATIGAKAVAAVPIATNQGFANFLPRTVEGEYLYYLLDLLTSVIKRLAAGTTFDEVSKRDIRTLWCAVPSDPDEQASIARKYEARGLGWTYRDETAMALYERPLEDPLVEKLLVAAIQRINPEVKTEAQAKLAVATLRKTMSHPDRLTANRQTLDLLRDGAKVTLNPGEDAKTVHFISFDPARQDLNDFCATNQYRVQGVNLVDYINGEIVVRQGAESETPASRSLENWLRRQAIAGGRPSPGVQHAVLAALVVHNFSRPGRPGFSPVVQKCGALGPMREPR